MRSHSQTETAGMTDQGMQQRLGSTLALRLGLLTLVTAGCVAGTVVHAQTVEIYDDTWADAAPLRSSQPLVVEGDRRATRPPTTVFIPDGASPPPAPQRVTPAAPSTGGQWAQVPPPEVDPTARWSRPTGRAAAVLPQPAPAQSSSDAGVRLAVPAPQVVGGPRARRSGASIQGREPAAQAPVRMGRSRTASVPLATDRGHAPAWEEGAGTARPEIAPRRSNPGIAPVQVPAPTPVFTPPGAAKPGNNVRPAATEPVARAPLPSALPASVLSGGRDGLGPGDSIRVTVFGQPDLETETVVGDDGSVSLPLINRVVVGGLSPQAAGDRIAAAYEAGDFLKDPQVSVVLEALKSRQISVLGAVKTPGRFPLDARLSTLDALALAGGVTDAGSLEVVLLRPSGGQTLRYDLDVSSLLSGQGPGVELAPGDTIYVPEAPKFYIYGEVQRPNAYPIREGSLTVMQAISLGGGLTDRGSDSRIQIRRESGDGQVRTLSADLRDPVRPNDVIYVKERLF